MKKLDILKRGIRNLRRNLSRTTLTVMAIGIGAFTLVLTLGVGNALENYIDTNISEATTVLSVSKVVEAEETINDVAVVPKYSPDAASSTFLEQRGDLVEVALSNQTDIDKLKSIEGVADVWPSYSIDTEYITTKNDEALYNLSSINVYDYSEVSVIAGEYPSIWGLNQTVIDEIFAATFNLTPEALIGSEVTIGIENTEGVIIEQQYTVIGVAEAVSSFGPTNDSSTGSITIGIDAAAELYDIQNLGTEDYGQHTALLATITDGSDEETVIAAIEATDSQYTVSSLAEIVSTLNTIVNFITIALIGFSGIAVIAAAFGIINTQLMSVFERTREIGLLKALGMSNKSVQLLFSYEAVAIGVIGACSGTLLALIVQLFVNNVFSSTLEDFGGSAILISATDSLIVITGLAFLAWIAGVIPARKAQNLDPIEALRSE